MNTKAHWDALYSKKAPDRVSWYRPHLETSLALIERANIGLAASIIDVGAGESTLADDLLARGYRNLTVLDISQTALNISRKRLRAEHVHWIAADVTQTTLPVHTYDLWHDRAVFHFLTATEQRSAYLQHLLKVLKPGGQVILAAFGLDAPARCSGLDVTRYSASSLAQQLGKCFRRVESADEQHQTPSGTTQPFVYCRFQAV